ncbi:hypothetical protein BSKO_12315 [Bryopsis sp. KO-2023]|nr:hypothetical protein BSKO_12315 [Bryopsis sp. KO-2023]
MVAFGGWLVCVLSLCIAASYCLGEEISVELTVSHEFRAPDGFTRRVVTVNGMFPADPIRVKQWDELVVRVRNKFASDTTTIHFHGINMNGTPFMDGVPYISQCPFGPEGFTYKFTVKEHPGTYFWHGHQSETRVDGLAGAIIVDPPQKDLGLFGDNRTDIPSEIDGEHTILLTDWYHDDSENIVVGLESNPFIWAGDPQSILYNGVGSFNCSEAILTPSRCNQTNGGIPVFEVEKGKTYLLRLISAGSLDWLSFGIDGHEVTLVQADGHPIKPVNVTTVEMNLGQRYDVILEADQPEGNYWINTVTRFRKEVSGLAILRYKGATEEMPKNDVPVFDFDFDPSEIRSRSKLPEDMKQHKKEFKLSANQKWVDGHLVWPVNNIPFALPEGGTPLIYHAFYDKLGEIDRNKTQFFEVNAGDVVDLVIENLPASNNVVEQHAWHLHGYHFYVLGRGPGKFNRTKHADLLNLVDPPLRDTATVFPNGTMLAAYEEEDLNKPSGWTLLRFLGGNPGVWPMHCHMAWHAAMRMQVLFIDKEGIPKPPQDLPECGKMEEWEKQYN